jgi:hypothetical protein
MNDFQIRRNEIQIIRNEIQAGWNKIQIRRNEIQIQILHFSFAESSLINHLRRPLERAAANLNRPGIPESEAF